MHNIVSATLLTGSLRHCTVEKTAGKKNLSVFLAIFIFMPFTLFAGSISPNPNQENQTIPLKAIRSPAAAPVEVPQLAGFYSSIHGGMLQRPFPETRTYYYSNGDTLSVVLVTGADCCAQFTASVQYADYPMAVTFADTSTMECDCGDRLFHITAAIENIAAASIEIQVYQTSSLDTADAPLPIELPPT